MNRRQFLATLGIGAPAAVLAAKAGLLERARTYFFAPKQGWIYNASPKQIAALTYDDLRLFGGGGVKMVMITNPGGVGHAWVHRALEQQYMRPLTVAMDRDSHLF